MKKCFALVLGLICLQVSAEELTPLSLYIHAHPDYLKRSLEVEYIANRCGAIMHNLAARTKEAQKSKEMKQLVRRYEQMSYSYYSAGLILSKSKISSEKKYIQLHKDLTRTYSDLILKNWKAGDMFKGIVGQDFEVCTALEPTFEKLSNGLNDAMKK